MWSGGFFANAPLSAKNKHEMVMGGGVKGVAGGGGRTKLNVFSNGLAFDRPPIAANLFNMHIAERTSSYESVIIIS